MLRVLLSNYINESAAGHIIEKTAAGVPITAPGAVSLQQ